MNFSVNRSVLFLLGFVGALNLGISTSTQAGDGYESQLKALQAKVRVQFNVLLPFVRRAEGVQNLTRLVFQSGADSLFGPEAAVQEVVIISPYTEDTTKSRQQRVRLRGHTLLFAYDGEDTPFVLAESPHYTTELGLIAGLEKELKTLLPQIELVRSPELASDIPSTNQSYIQLLTILYRNVDNIRYREPLRGFSRVVIDDQASTGMPNIQKFKYTCYEGGHVVTRLGVLLRVARDPSGSGQLGATERLIRQLLDMVALGKFECIDFTYLEATDLDQLVDDLIRFLTPERKAVLEARGVTRLEFNPSFDRKAELLVGNKLTLGVRYADMVSIYEMIFGTAQVKSGG
jgi:hypothetical protein